MTGAGLCECCITAEPWVLDPGVLPQPGNCKALATVGAVSEQGRSRVAWAVHPGRVLFHSEFDRYHP